ncbi:MAG: O-antigen ligase family protein, partial [Pseudomonadales bacterium]|nr:O-antigen ligase family protein [Pseudomonadales bacterium]
MKRDFPYYVVALGLVSTCIAVLTSSVFYIAPAIPIAFIALLTLYKRPEYGLLALVFFVPLEGVFAGNKLFTGPKLIGIALIAIVSIKLLRKELPISNMRSALWWPIMALILAFSLSSVFSPYSSVSIQSLKQLLTAISLFYITLAIKDQVKPLHLARVIVVSVSITAFFALLESKQSIDGRAIGLLTDPNYFALLLTTAIPFATFLLIHEKSTVLKLLWSISLIVILVAFEKTLSRSGLVVLVFVFPVLCVHYKEYLRKLNVSQLIIIVIGASILTVTLALLAPQEYRDRMLSLTKLSSGVHTFEDRSLGRRSSYIIVAFDEFKKHPILGSGPGTFPFHYAQSGYAAAFSLNKNEPELFRRAHNTYLETLAETGFLGLISLFGIVWLGLRQFKQARAFQIRSGNLKRAALATHYFAAFIAIVL